MSNNFEWPMQVAMLAVVAKTTMGLPDAVEFTNVHKTGAREVVGMV